MQSALVISEQEQLADDDCYQSYRENRLGNPDIPWIFWAKSYGDRSVRQMELRLQLELEAMETPCGKCGYTLGDHSHIDAACPQDKGSIYSKTSRFEAWSGRLDA